MYRSPPSLLFKMSLDSQLLAPDGASVALTCLSVGVDGGALGSLSPSVV